MPITFEPRFTRQRFPSVEKIGLVIPPSAKMLPSVSEILPPGLAEHLGQPTQPPHKFAFHYIDSPIPDSFLEDGTVIDNGVYEFLFRDGLISVFDLPAISHDQFSWSFSSQSQVLVLTALKIGQTLDVQFDFPLMEAHTLLKSHFPSGVPDSGYGKYPIHLAVDGLRKDGFRVVSCYEPQSDRTDSRLPFFFGFTVFGRMPTDPQYPIWRELLGQSVRQALFQAYSHSFLLAAFSLESFIDQALEEKLESGNLGRSYIEHVLMVAGKRHEIHALLNKSGTSKDINKVYDKLNRNVFKIRNALAHGKISGDQIVPEILIRAIKTVVEFIWDYDKSARSLLLPRLKLDSFEAMIDEQIISACKEEIMSS